MKFSVFSISIVLLVTFATLGSSRKTPKKLLCNELYRCSRQEDPVWTTTDNSTCEVFRNTCLMGLENCQRKNNNKPAAKVMLKDKCQKLCNEDCDRMYDPICGFNNDVKKQFGCPCQMDYYICQTGKTFDEVRSGECFTEDELNQLI